MHEAGFFVDVDFSGDTFNKKIRNAQVQQYNFILSKRFVLLALVDSLTRVAV